MNIPASKTSALKALVLASVVAFAVGACGKTEGGSAQKTEGEIKEAAGGLVGDQSLKREGQKDQVVGGVKETASDAKEAVKDAVD
jgi:uncharacterized protein YjbJ (UPF0337 family)